MKKTALLALSCITIAGFAQQYDKRGEVKATNSPVLSSHYEDELREDVVVNHEAWKNQEGLHAAFGSSDKLYFRKEVPLLDNNNKENNQILWKGERANIQILVWSADTLQQIRLELGNLKSEKGTEISKENIRANMVRYVLSNYPYAAKDAHCDIKKYENTYLMPDRFEQFDRFDLEGKTLRPIWVTIDIPQNAEAGRYEGIIKVKSTNQSKDLKVCVDVQNQVLPKPY